MTRPFIILNLPSGVPSKSEMVQAVVAVPEIGSHQERRMLVLMTSAVPSSGRENSQYCRYLPTPEFPHSTRHSGTGSMDPLQYLAEDKVDLGEF